MVRLVQDKLLKWKLQEDVHVIHIGRPNPDYRRNIQSWGIHLHTQGTHRRLECRLHHQGTH